jgi:hypothetical protein
VTRAPNGRNRTNGGGAREEGCGFARSRVILETMKTDARTYRFYRYYAGPHGSPGFVARG